MPKGRKAADAPNGDATPEDKQDAANHSPEDAADCFLGAKELKRQIAQMSQRLATHYARFENLGVDIESVQDCLKLEKKPDIPGKLKRIMTMAAILDLIPTEVEANGQLSVIPGLSVKGVAPATKAKINRAKVFWDGWDSGKSGDLIDACKFTPGSEDFVTWRSGWDDGHKEWAAKPKNANTTTASAEKRPPGRPRKQPEAEPTPLENDEEAYRAKAGETLHDVEPVTGTIQ